jgi:hypothetical protein
MGMWKITASREGVEKGRCPICLRKEKVVQISTEQQEIGWKVTSKGPSGWQEMNSYHTE